MSRSTFDNQTAVIKAKVGEYLSNEDEIKLSIVSKKIHNELKANSNFKKINAIGNYFNTTIYAIYEEQKKRIAIKMPTIDLLCLDHLPSNLREQINPASISTVLTSATDLNQSGCCLTLRSLSYKEYDEPDIFFTPYREGGCTKVVGPSFGCGMFGALFGSCAKGATCLSSFYVGLWVAGGYCCTTATYKFGRDVYCESKKVFDKNKRILEDIIYRASKAADRLQKCNEELKKLKTIYTNTKLLFFAVSTPVEREDIIKQAEITMTNSANILS